MLTSKSAKSQKDSILLIKKIFCRPFADLEKITRSSAYKRPFIDFSLRVMSAELAVEFSRLGRSLR